MVSKCAIRYNKTVPFLKVRFLLKTEKKYFNVLSKRENFTQLENSSRNTHQSIKILNLKKSSFAFLTK
jgi:hypothetical protein